MPTETPLATLFSTETPLPEPTPTPTELVEEIYEEAIEDVVKPISYATPQMSFIKIGSKIIPRNVRNSRRR
jgi:hypothetical protein